MSRRIKPKKEYVRISKEGNCAQFRRSVERGKGATSYLGISRPKVAQIGPSWC